MSPGWESSDVERDIELTIERVIERFPNRKYLLGILSGEATADEKSDYSSSSG